MLNSEFISHESSLDLTGSESSRLRTAVRPESLFITCTDSIMDQVIERIQRVPSILVLRSPGSEPPLETDGDDSSSSVIDHVLNQHSVRDIFVCGHSMCSSASVEDRQTAHPKLSGVDRMLQKIQHRQEMNERSREQVIQQMEKLARPPSVSRAISRGDLRVHGLFYLTESGTFTTYDELNSQFVLSSSP
ncbi:MAG: hypothetical protein KDA79_00835 [Planctomycetaceae bacterium]|nr:hypothetical protein [Planctomycetaceae bacterium]